MIVESKSPKKRFEFIDIAKGFAIIAVVLWHIGFAIDEIELFPFKTMFAGGMWHVPVFFILSGFFIKETSILNTLAFIKGKIISVHLVTLCFYIPAVLLHNVFIHCGFYSLSVEYGGKYVTEYALIDFFKQCLLAICFAGREPIVGPLWFAYVLSLAFIGYALLTCICRKIFGPDRYEKIRLVFCVLLAVVSAVLSNKLGLTINRFSNTLVVMLLLSIGQYVFQNAKVSFKSWYALGVALLFVWQSAVLNGNVNLNDNVYKDLFQLICGSICSLYVICFISIRISNTVVGKFIGFVGRKSFYIMALHFVSFKIFALLLNTFFMPCRIDFLTPNAKDNIFLLAGYMLFGVCVPLLVALIVSKVKKFVSVLVK